MNGYNISWRDVRDFGVRVIVLFLLSRLVPLWIGLPVLWFCGAVWDESFRQIELQKNEVTTNC